MVYRASCTFSTIIRPLVPSPCANQSNGYPPVGQSSQALAEDSGVQGTVTVAAKINGSIWGLVFRH